MTSLILQTLTQCAPNTIERLKNEIEKAYGVLSHDLREKGLVTGTSKDKQADQRQRSLSHSSVNQDTRRLDSSSQGKQQSSNEIDATALEGPGKGATVKAAILKESHDDDTHIVIGSDMPAKDLFLTKV